MGGASQGHLEVGSEVLRPGHGSQWEGPAQHKIRGGQTIIRLEETIKQIGHSVSITYQLEHSVNCLLPFLGTCKAYEGKRKGLWQRNICPQSLSLPAAA